MSSLVYRPAVFSAQLSRSTSSISSVLVSKFLSGARSITTLQASAPHSQTRQNVERLRLANILSWSVYSTSYQQIRQKSNRPSPIESSQSPLYGLWKPTHLQRLYYGPNSVKENLLSCLPNESSKAFILTGSSLANKTGLIKQIEEQLGQRHAATYSKIGQHAPVAQLDEATELVMKDETVDTIISVGGGSPIDSAKAISYRLSEKSAGKKFLHHITVPTTLSAAECTLGAGYTNSDGMKTGVAHPELAPHTVIYDSKFALETPQWLLMSTGMRAMDHAMELMYHPTSTEMPCRQMALYAAGELFKNLPLYKADPKNEDVITRLQLAAFASLGFLALNVKGGLGLSHTLGYALGSPYQIPHVCLLRARSSQPSNNSRRASLPASRSGTLSNSKRSHPQTTQHSSLAWHPSSASRRAETTRKTPWPSVMPSSSSCKISV